MQTKPIAAGRALEWYKQGWGIFSRDMKTWVIMMLILAAIAIGLSIIPFLGQIALFLIMPAFTAGLLYTAQEAASGKPIRLDYLWIVLQDPQKRVHFLVLGGAMLVAILALGILSAAFIGDGVLEHAKVKPTGISLQGGVVMLLLSFVFFIVFNYTAALVLFRNLPVFEALKVCAAQAVTYILPLAVFFLLYVIGSMIAAIPFGLGLLVFLPITIGAVYVSYHELFE